LKWIIALLPILLFACGPQYIQDPNATVFVTSEYDDGFGNLEINWIYPFQDPALCKPQADCRNKDDLSCSVILYDDAYKYMKEGDKLASQHFYLSASIEYLQALSRLYEAEIRLNRAQHARTGFMAKVQQRILQCEKMRSFYGQKHHSK
tara:strand:+ start:314 stop:760 length:447 start_codon:yes stop_codon:yes gene_type:complete